MPSLFTNSVISDPCEKEDLTLPANVYLSSSIKAGIRFKESTIGLFSARRGIAGRPLDDHIVGKGRHRPTTRAITSSIQTGTGNTVVCVQFTEVVQVGGHEWQ